MWTSEALLTAIYQAAPRDCITEERMVQMTGRTPSAITANCTVLREHGLIRKTGQGCHKLTDAGRAAVEQGATLRSGGKGGQHTGRYHKQNTVRGDAWLAMRILGRFSVADLVMRVARGGERAIEHNLRCYCRALERAGYLAHLPTREPGATRKGYLRYMLIPEMNTGPKPIVLRLNGSVYDMNTEKEITLKEAP